MDVPATLHDAANSRTRGLEPMNRTCPRGGVNLAKRKKYTDKSKTNKTGKGAAITVADDPIAGVANAKKRNRLEGGPRRNMMMRQPMGDTTSRPAFDLILEFDSLGQAHRDMGLSPAWQAVFQNSRDEPHADTQLRFAPYTCTESDRKEATTRLGLMRPLSETALAQEAFYNEGAAGNKAYVLESKAAIAEQTAFLNEISREIALHCCWLKHCIDISERYHANSTLPAGLGNDHLREGTTQQSTPFENYYDELMAMFDLPSLNLREDEGEKSNLAARARKALDLLSPVGFGAAHADAWTLSPDLQITMEGYLQGQAMCPWGTLSDDGDGNTRYVIQPPVFQDGLIDTHATNDTIEFPQTKLFATFGVPAQYDPAQPGFNALVGKFLVSDAPGTLAMYNAMNSIGVTGNMGTHPMNGETICWRVPGGWQENFGEIPSDFVTTGNATARTVRAWTLKTHELIALAKAASAMVDPLFKSAGIPMLGTIPRDGSLKFTRYDHSEMVDLVNNYSVFKIQYNPTKQIAANNGPFDPDLTEEYVESHWKPDYTAKSRRFIKGQLEKAFQTLTVPTGIGADTALVADWFAAVPPQIAMSWFNFDESSILKRQRTLIVPSGRNEASNAASSANQNPMRHLRLPLDMVFGCFRFRSMMPLSDISYLDDFVARTFELAPGDTSTLISSDLGEAKVAGRNLSTSRQATITMELEPSQEATAKTYMTTGLNPRPRTPVQFGADISIPRDNPFGAAVLTYCEDPQPLFHNALSPHGNKVTALVEYTGGIPFESFVTNIDLDATGNSRRRWYSAQDCELTLANFTESGAGSLSLTHRLVMKPGQSLTMEDKNGPMAPDQFSAAVNGICPAGHYLFDVAHPELAAGKDAGDVEKVILAQFPNMDALRIELGTFTPDANGYLKNINPVPVLLVEVDISCKGWPLRSEAATTLASDTSTGAANHMAIGHGAGLNLHTQADGQQYERHLWLNVLAAVAGDMATNITMANAFPASAGTSYASGTSNRIIDDHIAGKRLIPNLLNVKVTPELTLMDAAVANYSGMRLFPRAMSTDADFEGLPWFGEPQPFMRKFVEDLLPENLAYDRVTQNPFLDPSGRLLRVVTETYEQTGYSHGLLMLKKVLGDSWLAYLDIQTILSVQDTLVRRGQMG